MIKSKLTEPAAAASRVAQISAVHGQLYHVAATRDQTQAANRRLEPPAQFTDRSIQQDGHAVGEQHPVVVPVASGGRPGEPESAVVDGRGEVRHLGRN